MIETITLTAGQVTFFTIALSVSVMLAFILIGSDAGSLEPHDEDDLPGQPLT